MHKKTNTIIILVISISVIYAIIRYHIFNGVPLSYIIDVLNKGIALAAILLIALSLSIGPLARRFPNKFGRIEIGKRLFGLWGFTLSFFHTLISLLILKPNHYKIFYSFLKMNVLGEFVLISGFISLLLIGLAFITSFPHLFPFSQKSFRLTQFAGYIGCVVAGLHVFPIGVNQWTQISSWPGNMVPITFISFFAVIITVILRTQSSLMPLFQKEKS